MLVMSAIFIHRFTGSVERHPGGVDSRVRDNRESGEFKLCLALKRRLHFDDVESRNSVPYTTIIFKYSYDAFV
jgi:hypothetical protein